MQKHSVKYYIEHIPHILNDTVILWAKNDIENWLDKQFLYIKENDNTIQLVFENGVPYGILRYFINGKKYCMTTYNRTWRKTEN